MNAHFTFSPELPAARRTRMNTWQAIRADVLSRIQSGEWAPGALIPTEHELARAMGCARATVNRALRDLADSGIIQRRRKVGTRVTARPSRRTRLDMPAVRDEIEALGASYGYRLTESVMEPPMESAARALQVADDRPTLLVRAVYLADDRPHCCEMIWLNPRALPDLDRLAFETQSPHEWLAQNVPVTQAQFAILSESASGATALQLGLAPGTPLLVIERINLRDGVPVSFSRQFYPPRYRLNIND